MINLPEWMTTLPPTQQAIIRKCRHPSGAVGEFSRVDLDGPICRRFRHVVEQHAEQIAIQDGATAWTYRELNDRVEFLAGAILAQQFADSTPVGVLLPNGAPLMAALLGTWQAGKTVALLDPSFPQARVDAMLDRAGVRTLLAEPETIAQLARTRPYLRYINVYDVTSGTGAGSYRWPDANDPACIFFTSGSTGEPKAVVLDHRNLLHQTMLFTDAYGFCAEDRLALLSSGSGSAVNSALIALLNGAMALPFDVRVNGAAHLPAWLMDQRVSVCLMGTPLFRNLCEALQGDETFPDLRVIRLRSDAVRRGDLDLFKRHFARHSVLVNGLSSSETGLLTLCYFDHDSDLGEGEIPVGYPVRDKEIVILNERGQPLGCDQVGEIAVRSCYLSPGYWNNPELIRAKFIAEPESRSRLCRTGDLGMLRRDGALVHKGRRDFRVKIRGYGVDTAEVETRLREHPAIKDAVVLAKLAHGHDTQLQAYFTQSLPAAPTPKELRNFLAERLPHYMLPARFIQVNEFPLTPNGKIDRGSLPEAGNERPNIEADYQAPRTPVEIELTQIWAVVLRIDRVGIHDNFFDLGGHSLAASRVISRVIQTFTKALPLKALFDAPTVAQMAEVIDRHQGKSIDGEVLARLLNEVEAMNEEEAQKQLTQQSKGGDNT